MRSVIDSSTSVLDSLDDKTDFDEPKIAHIIQKDDEMRGYVFGEEVVALCGFRFVPTRDPHKFPMCKECLSVLQSIYGNGE